MNINIKKLKLSTYSILFIFFLSGCSEPIERINAGEDCKKCNLSNADLSGLTLNGIDLTGADLSGANLSNTKILGVNFTDATLKDADLSNSDMYMYDDGSGVYIGSKLEHQTRFVNSDLSGANLENAKIQTTIFLNSNLTNANLSYVEASRSTFKNANFTNTILDNFDFDIEYVVNPTFTISDNPMDSILETNKLRAKSKKLDLARKMFFDDYDGMFYSFGDAILRAYSVFDIVLDGGADKKFFGTDQQILYDTIRKNYDEIYYDPVPIREFLCDYEEMKSEKELPNIDQYDLQDQDKELYKMMVDATDYRKCTYRWPVYSDSPQTSLEDFLYDHFINLIEVSKISECPYVESSIKLLPAPRRGEVNSPKAALVIESNLQTASKYNKEHSM